MVIIVLYLVMSALMIGYIAHKENYVKWLKAQKGTVCKVLIYIPRS